MTIPLEASLLYSLTGKLKRLFFVLMHRKNLVGNYVCRSLHIFFIFTFC